MQNWKKLKSNPYAWEPFFIREKMVRRIREFFSGRGYHEVETPLLVPSVIPESYLEHFKTTLYRRNRKKSTLFLTTSPEASLKKLLVAGLGNCFEITKSFRNGETDGTTHNPEFTILEWYQVDADYRDVMDECQTLIRFILPKGRLHYQGKTIDLSLPFKRMTVAEAFEAYARVSFDEITDASVSREQDMFPISRIAPFARQKGYTVAKDSTWEQIFNQIFLNEVEPQIAKLTQPMFLYDYPRPMAALARLKKKDPRFAQRFELYIAGLELGDCYTELTNAKEQRARFAQSMREIKKNGKTPVIQDREFLSALETGLPECSGMAMGIDRLAMLLSDSTNISDVLFFPTSSSCALK